MSRVVAAVDNSPATRPVLAVAVALGRVLDAEVEALHVRKDGIQVPQAAARAARVRLTTTSGPTVDRLVEAARAPDVVALVVGARGRPGGTRPAGATATQIIGAASTPVVVVPPDLPTGYVLGRVLVPHEAVPAAAAKALCSFLERAGVAGGIEVVVLHVQDERSLPMFTDQPQHETDAWAQEFLVRSRLGGRDVTLELRVGVASEEILRVAASANADLIGLAWGQSLAPGRASVVREALSRSRVPVLLVPVAAEEDLERIEANPGQEVPAGRNGSSASTGRPPHA